MKPFRITSLEAHQIGPFGELKMNFPEKPAGMADKAEIHILTGENGVGKTTVLEMLVRSFSPGDSTRLIKKLKHPNGLFSKVTCSNGSILGYRLDGGKFLFEGTMDDFLIKYRQDLFGFEPRFEFAAFAYSGNRQIEQVEVSSLEEIHDKPFESATDFNKSVDSNKLLRWVANTKTQELIAKNDSDFEAAKRFKNAVEIVEDAIFKIIDLPIKFILSNNPLRVLIEVNHERLDFNLLPDGLKSIISWLADLLMRMDRVKWVDDIPVFERNFILFLDEIEVHMHPKWQRKILPAVQGLFPNAQIFISTHSPFVVGSVDGAWVHRLVKPNGDSVPDGEPFLSEDGKSVLLVLEEVFGITEQFGPGVEQDLKAFYSLRDEVLKGANGSTVDDLLRAGRGLAGQSTELQQIIEMEIRQVNRRKDLHLAL